MNRNMSYLLGALLHDQSPACIFNSKEEGGLGSELVPVSLVFEGKDSEFAECIFIDHTLRRRVFMSAFALCEHSCGAELDGA